MKTITVHGYDAFTKAVADLADEPKVVVFFCADLDSETGKSWCPDCVRAMPVVEAAAADEQLAGTLLHVFVGGRTFWKDQENPFRTKHSVSGVPTLMHKGKVETMLGDKACDDAEAVRKLFTSA